jgi:hypothetical protein
VRVRACVYMGGEGERERERERRWEDIFLLNTLNPFTVMICDDLFVHVWCLYQVTMQLTVSWIKKFLTYFL